MLLRIEQSNSFKRDSKLMVKRRKNMEILWKVIEKIALQQSLPPKFKDHTLIGNYKGRRECHISPDWLLIYRVEGNTLYLERTGTHSDLFG